MRVKLKKTSQLILLGLMAAAHLGCSMSSRIENLSEEIQSIRVTQNPGAHAGNFSSYSLKGECPKSLKSFQISTPVKQIVTCENDGTWSLVLDLSAHPDGAIDLVTDQKDSGTGQSIQFRIYKDTVAPNVQIYSTEPSPTNSMSIPVTVAFDEPVAGLTVTDFLVTNGIVSLLTGAGSNYIAYVTPNSSGTVTVSLGAGVANDLVGNPNLAAPVAVTIDYDGDRPSVLLSSLETNPTNINSITVDVVFSENVSGLSLSDFTVSGATASTLNGSGSVYELLLSATVSGAIQVQLPASRAEDVVGNENLASNVFSITYDNHNPTPTLSSAISSPTNVVLIPVVVNFDRTVTGFSAADLAVSNATVSDFSGSGSQYTFNLTPQAEGLVQVEVPANVSQSAVGLNNVASTALTLLVDTTPGTLLVSSPTPAIGNASQSFQWSLTYSDYHVITLTTADVSLVYTGTVSCANKAISGGGAIKSVTVSNCTGDGTVEIDIAAGSAADEAGNDFAAHTTSDAATVTNTPPAIAFSEPSPATGDESTEFIWTVTYSDANSISLSLADITVNGDTEGCTKSLVSTGTDTREIHVQGCQSAGGISLSIAAGTALGYGGSALATEPSAAAILTNQVLATMSQISSSVDKNPTGTSAQSFLFSLDKPFYRDVTVNYEFVSSKSTAVSPTNHNLQKGSVIIPAGQTNASIDYTYQDGATTGSKIVQVALTGTSEKVVGIKDQISRRMIQDPVAQDVVYSEVSLGNGLTCAVRSNGDLYCLSSNNSYGQLGNNTLTPSYRLQSVGNGFAKVGAGEFHACAIKGDASLWCWGFNTYGQVGDASNVNKSVPTLVGTNFAQVSGGFYYTCAISNDDDLYCWGDNGSGQFGNNTTTSSNVPVLIGAGYSFVDAGSEHTCAITTGGDLRCWGHNN
ncbi:Ig-like domain-containing protein, partial [Bdellovibrio sp. ArHS]|uniref:Ig-like domain-containing protein n=1 Tax=Bdellovibrio sp. ArHS TaxID=1569284 RepID=UPI0025BF60CB